jgi:hypothetical protein
MTNESPPTDSSEGRAPTKKPYRSPQLRVYGNIRDITQAAGLTSRRDGQGGGAMGFKSLA